MIAAELDQVTKRLGGATVLRELNLTVREGEVHGLVGPNGSGKTMSFRLLVGLIPPTSGRVRLFGEILWEERRDLPDGIAVLPENFSLLGHLTGQRNLEFLASLRGKVGRAQITEMLAKVGLDPDDGRPVRKYSKGMRQRLGLAQALMEAPRLLILDEPTNGLDPSGMDLLDELVVEQRDSGAGVLISSHHLDDLSRVCDRVSFIRGGTIVLERQVDEATDLRQDWREVMQPQ